MNPNSLPRQTFCWDLGIPCSIVIAVLTGVPVTSVLCLISLLQGAKKGLVQTLCDKRALWSLVLRRALAVAGAARGVGCAGAAVLTGRGASAGVAASTRSNRSCEGLGFMGSKLDFGFRVYNIGSGEG